MIRLLPRTVWVLRTISFMSLVLGFSFLFRNSWFEPVSRYDWILGLVPGIEYALATCWLLIGVSAGEMATKTVTTYGRLLLTLMVFTIIQFLFAFSIFTMTWQGSPGSFIGSMMWGGYAILSLSCINTPGLSKKEELNVLDHLEGP